MRQCECGGIIRQWDLTGGRERWECNECGRRETFWPKAQPEPQTTAQADLYDDE